MLGLLKRYQTLGVTLIALAGVLTLYGPHAYNGGYTLDDAAVIVNNPQVTWPPNLQAIFHGRYFGDKESFGYIAICRPMATLSFALEVGLGLHSAGARHLLQLGLYICLCLLLARLAYRLLRATAFEPRAAALMTGGGALLFALHPTHAEVCMSLAYRPEILSLLFVTLATSLLLDFRLDLAQRGHLPLLWLCFSAALLSKESAIAALGPWLAWALCRKGNWNVLKIPVISLLLPTLAFLAWRRWNIGVLTAGEISWHDNPLVRANLPTRLLTSLQLTSRALQHVLWPQNLAPDYTFNVWPLAHHADSLAFGGAAILLALAGLALLQLRNARRKPASEAALCPQELGILAVVWPLAFWLPVSNLLFNSTVLFADRLLFAVGVPLCWFVPAALCAVLKRALPRVYMRFGGLLVVLALVPIGWIFGQQSNAIAKAWRNDGALFAMGAARAPQSLRMQYNLAFWQAQHGQPQLAQATLKIARGVDARDSNVLALGIELAQKYGQCDSAQPYLATLKAITKPAVSARLAAVNWAIVCKAFRQGWDLAHLLPPRVPSEYRQKVFVLAVAAGDRKNATAWAKQFTPDPWQSAPWVAAAVYGFELDDKPLLAAQTLVTLAQSQQNLAGLDLAAKALYQRQLQHREAAQIRSLFLTTWPQLVF